MQHLSIKPCVGAVVGYLEEYETGLDSLTRGFSLDRVVVFHSSCFSHEMRFQDIPMVLTFDICEKVSASKNVESSFDEISKKSCRRFYRRVPLYGRSLRFAMRDKQQRYQRRLQHRTSKVQTPNFMEPRKLMELQSRIKKGFFGIIFILKVQEGLLGFIGCRVSWVKPAFLTDAVMYSSVVPWSLSFHIFRRRVSFFLWPAKYFLSAIPCLLLCRKFNSFWGCLCRCTHLQFATCG